METVTRQDLIDWFDTDNGVTDDVIVLLNEELSSAREAVFQQFGFNN